MLYDELFMKIETLYKESGDNYLLEREFWKFVKREYKRYSEKYSIEKEPDNFVNYVMRKWMRASQTIEVNEEVEELLKRATSGDINARNKLVELNMGLVKSRALKFKGRGIPLADLIQQGAIGLMIAIEKFDEAQGTELSTYAVSHIDGEMKRMIYSQKRNVKLGINLSSKFNALKRLEEERGDELTLEEIQEKLNVSEESARQLVLHQNDSISLNTLVGESQSEEFGNFVSSPESVEETILKRSMKSDVYHLLEYVNEKEKQVLIMLYGLYDSEKISTAEAARRLGLPNYQQVQQIEARALKRMRLANNILGMADYMDNPELAKEKILRYRRERYNTRNSKKSNAKKTI